MGTLNGLQPRITNERGHTGFSFMCNMSPSQCYEVKINHASLYIKDTSGSYIHSVSQRRGVEQMSLWVLLQRAGAGRLMECHSVLTMKYSSGPESTETQVCAVPTLNDAHQTLDSGWTHKSHVLWPHCFYIIMTTQTVSLHTTDLWRMWEKKYTKVCQAIPDVFFLQMTVVGNSIRFVMHMLQTCCHPAMVR